MWTMVTDTRLSTCKQIPTLVDHLRQKIPKHKNTDRGHLCVSEIKMQMTRENKQQDVFLTKLHQKLK